MGLSVTKEQVKQKCRIGVSDFDDEIDDLIDEQLPVIEFSILDAHLDDASNVGLQATLNLGALEVIAGEFLAQAHREPGASESFWFADVTVSSRPPDVFRVSISDPFGLKAQGWGRLSPYLKPAVRSFMSTGTDIRFKEARLDEDEVGA
jgi:hypothetical protein